MTSLRKALRAAMQSLLRGQSLLLQALLACWGRRPASLRRRGRRRRAQPAAAAAAAAAQASPAEAEVEEVGTKDGPAAAVAIAAADPDQAPVLAPGLAADALSVPDERPATAAAAATAAADIPKTSPSTSTSASASPSLSPSELSPNTTVASAEMPMATSSTPSTTTTTADAFLREAEQQLLRPLQGAALRRFARQLHAQLRDGLRASPACMLPSHTTQLPTGRERGRYLTLDVGGSTLRVAVIALEGAAVDPADPETADPETAAASGLRILQIEAFKITPAVKQLPGIAFFDWMAARIVQVVDAAAAFSGGDAEGPLPMGLAWSFPIDGRLQGMGKGFVAADTLLGQDLGTLIEAACRARGLAVRLAAIVNDAPAALLSTAYARPRATRFGLILGTGVNMAVHVPIAAVGAAKLGPGRDGCVGRPTEEPHVLINTELGMFGGDGILPLTRWDALLNAGHPKPLFQPLEHLVSGYYLGEVVRFALLDAVAAAGLFGGAAPPSLCTPYALDTETLSRMEAAAAAEADADKANHVAAAIFHERHPAAAADTTAAAPPPSAADMAVVRALAALVAQRSAALVAAAIYALWALKVETETERVQALEALALAEDSANAATAAALQLHRAERDSVRAHTVVGYNGSVIEQYPQYRARCQAILDELLVPPPVDAEADAEDDAADADAAAWSRQLCAGGPPPVIDLVPAHESSLQGAAVALACLES